MELSELEEALAAEVHKVFPYAEVQVHNADPWSDFFTGTPGFTRQHRFDIRMVFAASQPLGAEFIEDDAAIRPVIPQLAQYSMHSLVEAMRGELERYQRAQNRE